MRGGCEDPGVTLHSIIASRVVGLLAVVGCVGLVYRLARSGLRLGLSTLESASARGLVEVSVRQGDLTGMAERQQQARTARRARLRAALLTLLWLVVLVAPVVAGISRPAYALASLLWLLPRKPLGFVTTTRIRRG